MRDLMNANGVRPSRLGLGCLVLTRSYEPVDATEARATFDAAADAGITLLDTSNSYANGENEQFVGRAIAGRRNRFVLSTKFGLSTSDTGQLQVNGRPEYVAACCDQSLSRLGVDVIDLYYQHRVDPDVPLEETVGAMADLVQAGKVRALGLCEVTADQLRRAHDVHPISAIQSEWSLWARQIEAQVLPAARELGTLLIPYSPLGRGMLAGAFLERSAMADGDLRRRDPRLQGENLNHNLELVLRLRDLAASRGLTAAQLALAWLLAQGPDVLPIPGVERRPLLAENLAALTAELAAEDLATLDALFAPGVASGDTDTILLRNLAPRLARPTA